MLLETTILLDGLVFPESPRWHADKLWFSDIYDQKVLTVDLAGHCQTVATLPGWPSGLGWLPDDRLVIVSIMERALLRLDSDRLLTVADLRTLEPGGCNDMVVSQQGGAYIGRMGYNPFTDEPYAAGGIILVTLDGTARIVADQLDFPNGMAITPDGRTLIIAESLGECLTAFDIAQDGSLVNRHIWAQLKGTTPDGICLDAEGAIWVADFGNNEILRVCEGGLITQRVRVANTPLACMLGGVDRRTLFVTTTATNQPEDAVARKSGCIEIVRVEVPGAGLP